MPAPLSPEERVRRLTALAERGESTLLVQLARELGIEANALAEFRREEIADHGTVADAMQSALAQLSDQDIRAAAASAWMSRSKTMEHARRAFNAERGETVGWSSFKALLLRAADRGLDGSTPTPPPPGQVIKGLSTLAVRNPETGEWDNKLVWTKTKAEAPGAAEAIAAAADALRRIPRLSPIAAPSGHRISSLMNFVPITDLHIGQASDAEEGGAAWSAAEAERVMTACFEMCLRGAPPAQKLLISILGDFLDYEGPKPQTFENRHPLPTKDGFHRMVKTATRLSRTLTDRGLETHEEVVLAVVDGNHDPVSSIWLRQLLEVAYEKEPRVSVLYGNNPGAPHCAYLHGRVMLGFHHQHLVKSEKMPGMFSDEYAEMWGKAVHREGHCGHLHQEKVETHPGMTVYQHPTLAARSRHVSRHAWNAARSVQIVTYHETTGRGYYARVTPEMIGFEPAFKRRSIA